MRRSHTQKVTKQEAETINARTWLDKHPILGGALIGTGAALATAALAYGATKAYPYAEFAYGELVAGANELKQLAEQRESILHQDKPPIITRDPQGYQFANKGSTLLPNQNSKLAAEVYEDFSRKPHPEVQLYLDSLQKRPFDPDEKVGSIAQRIAELREQHDPNVLIMGNTKVTKVPMTLEQRRKQHRYHQESLPEDTRKVMFETPPEVSREEAVRKQHARTTEEEWLKGPDYGIEPSQPLPTPYPTKLYKWPLLERHLQVALKNHENKDLRTIDLRNSKNRDPVLEDQLRSRYNHITKGMHSTTQDQVNLRKIARKKVMAEVDQYTQRLLTPGYQNPEVQRYQALLEAYTSS